MPGGQNHSQGGITVSLCFETLSHYVVQTSLEFVYVAQLGLVVAILLPQPAERWDYRCMPPHSMGCGFFALFSEVYLLVTNTPIYLTSVLWKF